MKRIWYISFQDSDDFYHCDKIEKQYKNLIKKKSDFDFCKVNFYLNETYKVIFPFKSQEYNIMRNKISSELCNGNFITTQSILVKTNVIIYIIRIRYNYIIIFKDKEQLIIYFYHNLII